MYFKQNDIFPIIAEIIEQKYQEEQRYITHNDIVQELLKHPLAKHTIDIAFQQSKSHRTPAWLASNMVSWFSQRITVDMTDWKNYFDRKKIQNKWAYKPKTG